MIRQVPPCPRGGLKCSAAQLGPKGQKKTKCGNSQRSPELLALVMESVGASSPGTFLGSLDAFRLYLYFQKCQLVYMTRAEAALLQRCVIEEWRGFLCSGAPGRKSQSWWQAPGKGSDQTVGASDPSSEWHHHPWKCTDGTIYQGNSAKQSQKSREYWFGALSTVACCSHRWPHIFLVSSPAKRIKFRLFSCYVNFHNASWM